MTPHGSTARKPLEKLLAPVMFFLSIVFLILLAGLLHRHRQFAESDVAVEHNVELLIQLAGLTLLWPVFILEALWRFFQRDRRESVWKHLGLLALICLIPPLRIGVRSQAPDRALWLPYIGWHEVDRYLRRRLERFFSAPMILIVLMVLPLLALEYGWQEEVKRYEALELLLAVGTAVIWFAFAVEFIVMVSVAPNRLLYCAQHWIDLAIILLPFADALPLLRLLRIGRVLRLEPLTRVGRLHRLRGLLLKAWRAVLLLEVIQRLTGQTLEKRLGKLKDLHAAKEEELEELRTEIEVLQKQIAQKKQAEAASDLGKDTSVKAEPPPEPASRTSGTGRA